MNWTHEEHQVAMDALRVEHNAELRRIAEWQKRMRSRLERVEALAEKWATPGGGGRGITHAEAAEYIRDALKDPE